MANCLVTKLKGVVDNADLLKLNEIRLVAKTEGNHFIHGSYTNDTYCEIIGEGEIFANNGGYPGESLGKHTTLIGDKRIFFSSGSTLSISNKYNMNYMFASNIEPFDLTQIKYTLITTIRFDADSAILNEFKDIPNVTKLNLNGNKIFATDFENLNNDVLEINLTNTNCIDFIKLSSKTKLETLSLSGAYNIVNGVIENLSTCVSLNYLNFPYAGSDASDHPITGSVTTLLNNMAINRSSGRMFICANNVVTLPEGITAYNPVYINFGTSMINPTSEDTARGWQIENVN